MSPTALPPRAALVLVAALAACGTGASAAPWDDPARTWYMHTGGISHHLQQTRAAGRQWNEAHAGVGIEARTIDDDGWSVRHAVGAMQDSRGFWGGYAGMGWMQRWSLGRGASVSAGAGVYAFYRSVNWRGDRALVPAVLPTMSVDLLDHTVGLNVVAVPPMRTMGAEPVPTVMMQFVVRLR